jgi:hypothetical protein
MGYRSQICIAITKEVISKDLFLQNPLLPEEFIEDSKRWDKDYHADYWIWHADSIKWYPEYESVKETHAYLNSLKDKDFHFLRIGEDCDDIEYEGNLDVCYYPETTINWG